MEFRLAMEYDEAKDEYTCKGGRKLIFETAKTKKSPTGYISEAKVYRCESCNDCPYYGKCYKGTYSKSIQVSERFDYFRVKSRKNIVYEKRNTAQDKLLHTSRRFVRNNKTGLRIQEISYERYRKRSN